MSDTEPDIYSFFESFKEYKTREEEMKVMFSRDTDKPTCETHSWGSKKFGDDSANNICVKFKILCKVIKSKKRGSERRILNHTDYTFLNYWLNSLSKKTKGSHNLTVYMFQDTFSNIEEDFFNYGMPNEKLYDIKNEHFNNMILLSDLYDNMAQIFYDTSALEDEKISCIKYFQKYINTYKQGIIKCPNDNTSFCKALKHFKNDYEQKFLGVHSISEKCIDRENLLLPTYDDVSLEKKNTIVGSILGPSFATLLASFFLYKFTPLRQWIRTKMGSTKEAQSNLYDENNQLFLDTSDNNYTNFDEIPYRISYDSAVIS
ncbi:Plasmodium vivax Vir protein, putative [Plasmodium ovale]|uniref:Plasmodium vivax Vir protein, putative n=1 Tax=Plasmodium ovale TaxID=36330 RepID=A0A1C3KI43_PLAOA|nr:Plasmodium vivax Vir protein, putative [Plasmodium ovale]